jgi:hypothetical protein
MCIKAQALNNLYCQAMQCDESTRHERHEPYGIYIIHSTSAHWCIYIQAKQTHRYHIIHNMEWFSNCTCYIHACSQLTWAHTYRYTYIHTNTHAHTHKYAQIHRYTHMIHTHRHKYAHIHRYTHMIHTQTHIHTYIHAHMHIHTCTYGLSSRAVV